MICINGMIKNWTKECYFNEDKENGIGGTHKDTNMFI